MNTGTYIFKALFFVAILLFSACDDFLNTPPNDKLPAYGFYSTPKQIEQGLIGTYSLLRQLSNSEYRLLSETRSDNVWANPIPNGGFRDYSELSCFRALPNLPAINNVWNQWYQVIYNANKVLAGIPDVGFGSDEAIKNQFTGELYFLRGWAYFELVRLFGGVPLISEPLGADDAANVPRSTIKEVYDQRVLADLKEAKRLLPTEADLKNIDKASVTSSGRAGKLAATAMLGRVYMTMSGYPLNENANKALAKAELKEIIDFSEANGNRFWAPDSTEWKKQWISENNNKYSIFAIQYRLGGTGNPAISEMTDEWPATFTKWTPGIATEGWIEKTLAYEFTRDYAYTDGGGIERTRKDARGFGQTLYAPDFPDGCAPGWNATKAKEVSYEDVTVDGATLRVVTNGYMYKYLNSILKRQALGYANIDASLKDRSDWPVNYPVIRYEDVLLMYAELLAGEGANGDGAVNTTTALGIVNKIRERAGCAPETDATKTMDFIKRERRVELACEGVRWFDIVRWGEWKTVISDMLTRYGNVSAASTNNVREGCYLYPIPEAQLNVNPGLYSQNEGYE